jgi:hypothetical protein
MGFLFARFDLFFKKIEQDSKNFVILQKNKIR